MITFWLIAAAMVLLVLIVIVRALGLRSHSFIQPDQSATISLYKTRLEELERDLSSGTLPEDQYQAAREEIELALLEKLEDEKEAIVPTPRRDNRLGILVIVLFLPVFAMTLYLSVGQPRLSDPEFVSARQNANEELPPINEMIEQLQSHLSKEPEDEEGWLMLTRTYLLAGEADKAVSAAERLYELTGDVADTLIIYIQALLLAEDGNFSERSEQMINRLLSVEPDHKSGLWLAGLAAERRGDYEEALDYWQRLLVMMDNEPEPAKMIEDLIARAKTKLEDGDATTLPPPVPKTGTSLVIEVTLSPTLQSQVSPEDILFVYARANEGPAMPLAIAQRQVKDLPLLVTLDDSMAMMPGMNLSAFDTIDVLARVSKSGEAVPQSGDLLGQARAVDVREVELPLAITISDVMP